MKENNTMKTLIKVFFLSIILSFGFEFILKDLTLVSFYNLIENILFAILLFLLVSFLNSKKIRLKIIRLAVIIFNLSLLIESLYYYLFDSYFSTSAIFVGLETNPREVKEFIATHVDKNILIFLIFFVFLSIWQLNALKGFSTKKLLIFSTKKARIISVLIVLLILKFSNLIVFNLPYLLVKVPLLYVQEMKKFETYGKENFYGNFTNVKHENLGNEKELFVILIGESTNRFHFQLYNNYYRNTTPRLKEIKDELIVLNNVISPHTYTIGSLSKALTLGNYEDPEKKYNGSIIQLFNQAKFSTYWISNQRPVGMMDTHVTKIGTGAYKSIFLNTKHTNDNTLLDAELINSFKDIIEGEGDRKVVFFHMLGTHMDYKKRYPKEFEYFQDKPQTNYKKKRAFQTINAYDNAVMYNDFLIRNVIELVRKENVNSYVLFFSDHGQEVFDDMDFFGHTIDEEITKNMYEIPMFLWTSDNYKMNKMLNLDVNKKYMIDDLIHSIADISNIKSHQIDSTRSIFNNSYKERKRIIKDTINYDEYFN